MLGMLCSKSFLFIAEGDEDSDRHTLNDWEIASRLWYLLWSTMPDDELFSLAEAGKLRDRTDLTRHAYPGAVRHPAGRLSTTPHRAFLPRSLAREVPSPGREVSKFLMRTAFSWTCIASAGTGQTPIVT